MSVDINIANYEEYLLSFIDGELDADAAAALEAFLEQHPHIRQELALLQATRLEPDQELTFTGKAALYRHTAAETPAAGDYEELLLDYVDNELDEAGRQQLERLMAAHPHIRQELALLQAARLEPDMQVTFPGREALYRRSRARVRPLVWWSAAAAVVAALAVWVLPRTGSRQPAAPQMAATRPQQPAAPAATTPLPQPPAAAAPQEQAPAIASAAGTQAPAAGKATAQPGTAAASRSLAANSGRRHLKNEKAPLKAATPLSNKDLAAVPAAAPDGATPASTPVLAQQLPQPRTTTAEVVEEHREKIAREQDEKAAVAAIPPVKTPVLAANTSANNNNNNTAQNPAAAAAPIQGELIMSVTSNGDSRLLNGVASVARFFARKKNK